MIPNKILLTFGTPRLEKINISVKENASFWGNFYGILLQNCDILRASMLSGGPD